MKKLISSLIITVFILLSCITSNAADVVNISLKLESKDIKEGDEVVISLQIDSVSEIDGIYGIGAELEYDDEIFELINVIGVDNWNALPPQEGSGRFLATCTSTFGCDSGTIAKITLKMKKAPIDGIATVVLKDIEMSDTGFNEIKYEDLSCRVIIKDPQTSSSVPKLPEETTDSIVPDASIGENASTAIGDVANSGATATPNKQTTTSDLGKTTEQETEQTTKNANSNDTKGDSTTSKSKIPAAGLDITIVLVILSAIVIGTATFIRYKKVK